MLDPMTCWKVGNGEFDSPCWQPEPWEEDFDQDAIRKRNRYRIFFRPLVADLWPEFASQPSKQLQTILQRFLPNQRVYDSITCQWRGIDSQWMWVIMVKVNATKKADPV